MFINSNFVQLPKIFNLTRKATKNCNKKMAISSLKVVNSTFIYKKYNKTVVKNLAWRIHPKIRTWLMTSKTAKTTKTVPVNNVI